MRRQSVTFRTLLTLLVGTAGLHLAGCSRQPKFEFTRLCMGVQTRVTVHAGREDLAVAAAVQAYSRIEQVEQALSDYRPESDAMRLCRLADLRPGVWLPVAGDLRAALLISDRIASTVGGTFSVTIGPAVQLWRQSRRSGKLPSEEAREKAVQLSDQLNIELDEAGTNIRFHTAGVRLDFGGMGKGYAAQAAIDDVGRKGFRRTMVALSGDIAVGDPPPGASGWRIHVRDGVPDLLLANAAVSTSGDSEQFVESDGMKYSHIVDPRTGLGFDAPRGVLVTVVARHGAIADALGTAIYAMPIELAPAMLRDWHAAAILVIGDPQADPEIRVIDPFNMLRWAE